MKAKKDTKQLLFENMAKLNPDFKIVNEIVFDDINLNSVKVGGESFEKIKKDFPGPAKSVNPIDSPQHKWYKEVFDFMQGEWNNVFEKAELVKFFQNNFLGVDYNVLQTPAETVSWWLSPEQQEFIKSELNATPEKSEEELSEENPVQQPSNKKYMDDTTIEKVISTLIDAKNNIQDIFEKLPIAEEIPENEAKILMNAMTVLHNLEVRYGNENHGITAINR